MASSTPGGEGPNGGEIQEVLDRLRHDDPDKRPREPVRDETAAASPDRQSPGNGFGDSPPATKPSLPTRRSANPGHRPSSRRRPPAVPRARASAVDSGRARQPAYRIRCGISTAKLDGLFLEAEELLALEVIGKPSSGRGGNRLGDGRSLGKRVDGGRRSSSAAREQSWEVHGRAEGPHRQPMAAPWLAGLADRQQDHLRDADGPADVPDGAIEQDRRTTARMVDRVLEDAKKLLMLPFSTLFSQFPKLVRDLSRDQGKEVELVVRGTEVEVDKRILEEIKDPLTHLLRNCIDHGIETPMARAEAGKPSRGTITLSVSQVHGNKVEVCLADDGAGIDLDAVARLPSARDSSQRKSRPSFPRRTPWP